MSTLYTYLSRSWRKKPLIAGNLHEKFSDLYHLYSLTFIFFVLSFIKILLKSLFILLQGMNEEWKIFNQDIEYYIHISHLKSFQIPVEIQNWFYNISFIFTTLHFTESLNFFTQRKM